MYSTTVLCVRALEGNRRVFLWLVRLACEPYPMRILDTARSIYQNATREKLAFIDLLHQREIRLTKHHDNLDVYLDVGRFFIIITKTTSHISSVHRG